MVEINWIFFFRNQRYLKVSNAIKSNNIIDFSTVFFGLFFKPINICQCCANFWLVFQVHSASYSNFRGSQQHSNDCLTHKYNKNRQNEWNHLRDIFIWACQCLQPRQVFAILSFTHTYTYVHMYVCKWWCTNKGTWQNKMPAEGILSIFDAFRYLNAKGQWHLWQQA